MAIADEFGAWKATKAAGRPMTPAATAPAPTGIAGEFGTWKAQKKEAVRPEPQKAPGLISKIGGAIGGAVNEGVGTLEKSADFYGGDIKKLPEAALRTAGAAGKAATDIGFGVAGAITPKPVKEAAKAVVGKVMEDPLISAVAKTAGEAYGGFKTRHPRAAEDIEAAFNVAMALPAVEGAKVASKAATSAAEGAVRTGGEILAKRAVESVPKMTTKAEDLMYEVLRPAKGEIASYEIKKGRDLKEVAGEIARQGIRPTIENGAMGWKAGVDKMKSFVAGAHPKVQEYLKKTGGTVDLADVAKEALDGLSKTVKNAEELEIAKGHVKDLLKAEALRYGGTSVPRDVANEIKSGMWQVGYDATKPLRNKVARQVGHFLDDAVNKGAPAVVKELNRRMSLAYDAIDVMTKATGRVIKGGRLEQYASGLIGAFALSGIPYIGPVGGYLGGKRLYEEAMKLGTIGKAKKAGKLMSKAEKLASKALEEKPVISGLLESGAIITPKPPDARQMTQEEIRKYYESIGAFPKPEPKISGLLSEKAGPSSKVIELQSPGVAEGQAMLRGENVPGRMSKAPAGAPAVSTPKEAKAEKGALQNKALEKKQGTILIDDDASAAILEDLRASKAGFRSTYSTAEDKGPGFRGIVSGKSSFPNWIPENLRTSDIVQSVVKHIDEGTMPTKPNEVRLYQIVKERIARTKREADFASEFLSSPKAPTGEGMMTVDPSAAQRKALENMTKAPKASKPTSFQTFYHGSQNGDLTSLEPGRQVSGGALSFADPSKTFGEKGVGRGFVFMSKDKGTAEMFGKAQEVFAPGSLKLLDPTSDPDVMVQILEKAGVKNPTAYIGDDGVDYVIIDAVENPEASAVIRKELLDRGYDGILTQETDDAGNYAGQGVAILNEKAHQVSTVKPR